MYLKPVIIIFSTISCDKKKKLASISDSTAYACIQGHSHHNVTHYSMYYALTLLNILNDPVCISTPYYQYNCGKIVIIKYKI